MRVTQARCMFEATGVRRINWTVRIHAGPGRGHLWLPASYPTPHPAQWRKATWSCFSPMALFEVEDATRASFNEEQLRVTVSRHAALAPEKFFDQVLGDIRKYSAKHSLTTFALLGCKFTYTE